MQREIASRVREPRELLRGKVWSERRIGRREREMGEREGRKKIGKRRQEEKEARRRDTGNGPREGKKHRLQRLFVRLLARLRPHG